MSDQPLIQFNPGMKPNDMSNVCARFSTEAEMHEAARLAILAAQVLAGPIKALQKAIDQAPADAVQLLQQELGAQVIGEQNPVAPPAPMPMVQQQYAPQAPAQQWQAQQPQAPQGQPQPNAMGQMAQQHFAQAHAGQAQQYAMPQQPMHQAPPAAVAPSFAGDTGPCWACNKPRNCPDCQGPTNHVTAQARGKTLNIHECISGKAAGQRHKAVWCSSPIWKSKVAAAQQQGIALPPGLVYE